MGVVLMDILTMLNEGKFNNVAKFVGSYIDDFEKSEQRKAMIEGKAYYKQKNTEIMKRQKIYYISKGVTKVDPYKANHKLPSGFLKLLIKQKVNYSINSRIKLAANKTKNLNDIEMIMGKDWKKTIKQAANEASIKSAGYVQFYIDKNEEFNYKIIPSEQCVPVFSIDDPELLEYFIRYYQQIAIDDEGKSIKILKVEFWTNDLIYYFVKQESGEWEFASEDIESENPKPHIKKLTKFGETVANVEGQGWGRPPFAVLYNNDEKTNDLEIIKPFIDIFDIVNSDFANNIDDFQDIYWILKNYNGEDLEDFLSEVKELKVLRTGDDGEARAETIDIPVEARKEMLDNTEKLIYKFGMGVNPDDIEGNITNVRIKALYSNLDLKANDFEIEVQDFMNQFLYFLNRYLEIKKKQQLEDDDIYLVFNRSMIINEVEMLDANANQAGSISNRTRLENHPWVPNVDDEFKRMSKEMKDIDLNTNNLDNNIDNNLDAGSDSN